MASDVEKTADQAWRIFKELISGDRNGGRTWPDLFSQLGDEVDLIWPYPPDVGHYTGNEGRRKFEELFGQLISPDTHFPESNTVSKTVGTDRVIYEDHSKGIISGVPYEGRHCVHLLVAGGKVVGYHEYQAPVANPA
jgi:ketosteroid isomerase-like protein